MPEFQKNVDIGLAIIVVLSFILIWTTDISLETQFIPTIINGVSSSISLIVGFTATAISLTVSREEFKASQHKNRIIWTIILLILAILFLFFTYLELIDAKYQSALRLAMSGLAISFCTLFDFLGFLCSKLEIMHQD